MSSASVANAASVPKRRLAGRPGSTVDALVNALPVEVAETGFEGLTVRNVARRAGVSPATAYSYFASKEHLLSEVFWRRLAALDPLRPDFRRSPEARVEAATSGMSLLVADEPELSAAVTTALLAQDPDVRELRDRIGATFAKRIAVALGPDADPVILQTLMLTFMGAILAAGLGNLTYQQLPQVMREATALVFGKGPAR